MSDQAPEPAGLGNCRVCAFLESGTATICYRCARQTIEALASFDERCGVCDLPLREDGTCGNPLCNRDWRQFGWNYAIAMRSGVLEQAINAYKYENKFGWCNIFARVLVGFLDEQRRTFEGFDLIVASPTYLDPEGPRRYDHTRDVIRAAFEESESRWPFDVDDPAVIVKIAATPPLVGRTFRERREIAEGPLRDALRVPDSEAIEGKAILVYDDVFTDGSTLDEVARCLRGAGATEVCGVSLTRQPWRGA